MHQPYTRKDGKKFITIMIRADLHERICAHSQGTGISRQRIFSDALEMYFHDVSQKTDNPIRNLRLENADGCEAVEFVSEI